MARYLGWLLPGLPQMLRGRFLGGGIALVLWLCFLSIAVIRWNRVLGTLTGGDGDRLALFVLLAGLIGCWTWSQRETRRQSGLRDPGIEANSSLAAESWRGFRKNRLALLGLGVVLGISLAALLAPLLAPFDPLCQPAFQESAECAGDATVRAPPSGAHFMGTDQLSRDVFSRILHGSRVSLGIGILAVLFSLLLGVLSGAVAGYLGGVVDWAVMRVVDLFMSFPRIVLLIALVAVFPRSLLVVVLALALTQWPYTARIVRAEMLSLREREFAEAARALGFSRSRILFRHLLPNALGPIIVVATLGIGSTILLESGLSFLGLGVVDPPSPSWGMMVASGREHLRDAWWIATFSGLAIAMTVLAFNLVGDGLRDALDPRQEGGSIR